MENKNKKITEIFKIQ